MPGNWHVRFGGGPYGKGPANCGHLAVRPTQPSLEDWFLSVTSRLGDPA
jgi:hypothetical protein